MSGKAIGGFHKVAACSGCSFSPFVLAMLAALRSFNTARTYDARWLCQLDGDDCPNGLPGPSLDTE
jgi:hypothetical protein